MDNQEGSTFVTTGVGYPKELTLEAGMIISRARYTSVFKLLEDIRRATRVEPMRYRIVESETGRGFDNGLV